MSGPADLSDDDLVAHALAVHVLADDDTEVYDACVAELQRRGTPAIADRALDLLGDPRPEARALGAEVLGRLGAHDGLPYAEASVGPLVELARSDADPLVLDPVVAALGHLGDPQALGVVLAAAAHPHFRVRSSATKALPSLAGVDGFVPEDHPVVEALVLLAGDPEPEVRNWALFGLGTQLRVDGSRIRAVLALHLDDPDDDARAEALAGLARRRVPALAPHVRAALEAETVGRLAVQAAAYLATPDLSRPLAELQGWWDVDEPLLAAAIAASDPAAQAAEVAALAALVDAADGAVPDGWTVVVGSDLVPVDERPVVEAVDRSGDTRRWSFDALLAGAGGAPARAGALLAAELAPPT